MARSSSPELSRREREILEILYRLESASAAEVQEAMADAPSYSAVRAHLRILEEKGHIHHARSGQRYIFSPTVPREKARRNALRGLLHNFFSGSREEVVATLLDMKLEDVDPDELERLADLIEEAREEGR
jgi:BlaI family transcriptional regulator, penicillinase repressor